MGGDVPQTEAFRKGMGRSSSNNTGLFLSLVEGGEWVANHMPLKIYALKGGGHCVCLGENEHIFLL